MQRLCGRSVASVRLKVITVALLVMIASSSCGSDEVAQTTGDRAGRSAAEEEARAAAQELLGQQAPVPGSDPGPFPNGPPAGPTSQSDGSRPSGAADCRPKSHSCDWLSETAREVPWDTALAWWPHRPVLSDDTEQHFGQAVESVVVGSDSGGTSGDPRSEVTYLMAVYQTPQRTLRDSDLFGVLSAGGMAVWTTSYPPGHANAPGMSSREGAKFTTVRGRQALIFESPGQDFRQMYYVEPTGSGGTLVTSFYSALSQRTDDQAVKWANQLDERR